MTRDEIAMIADAAAEMAQLSLIPKNQVKIFMETLLRRFAENKIMMPMFLDAELEGLTVLDGRLPPKAGEVIRLATFSKALINHQGLLVDKPTKAYFDVFAAVWESLQPYRTDDRNPPAPEDAPRPARPRGQRGIDKKVTDPRDPMTPGLR